MATTADHMAARGDQDLLNRLIAKAEQLNVPEASSWIQARMGKLVTEKVDGTQTITDVHAYASNVRKEYLAATPPPPGENLGAVTDEHLKVAIESVLAEEAVVE